MKIDVNDNSDGMQILKPSISLADVSMINEVLRSPDWDQQYDQQVGHAQLLMTYLLQQRQGRFVMNESIFDSLPQLEDGRDLLKNMPEATPTIRRAASEFVRYLQDCKVKKSSTISDYAAEKDAHVRDAISAEKIRENLLLNDIYEQGTMIANAPVSLAFGRERGTASGFQNIVEPRNKNLSLMRQLIIDGNNAFKTDVMYLLRKQGHEPAALVMNPITKETPIFEKTTKQKGIFSFMQATPLPKKIGTETRDLMMSDYIQGQKDEPAYCITYRVQGTEAEPYTDPDTSRDGCGFVGCIVLSQSLAERAYKEMQNNPRIVRKIFKKFDPALMSEQEMYMPSERELFILPPRETVKGYNIDANGTPIGINEEYIKRV